MQLKISHWKDRLTHDSQDLPTGFLLLLARHECIDAVIDFSQARQPSSIQLAENLPRNTISTQTTSGAVKSTGDSASVYRPIILAST